METPRRTVLLVSGTSNTARATLSSLKKLGNTNLTLKASYRKQEQADEIRTLGAEPIQLDLDKPETFKAS